jgi:hypothetical protein
MHADMVFVSHAVLIHASAAMTDAQLKLNACRSSVDKSWACLPGSAKVSRGITWRVCWVFSE